MPESLFRKIDCYMLKADDLDASVAFYRDRLGHSVIWRTEEAVAFRLPGTDAELVVHTLLGPTVDLLVEDADAAYRTLLDAGARSVKAPFDIRIGRCAAVEDPFGNVLTVLDQSKGELATDAEGKVIGLRRGRASEA